MATLFNTKISATYEGLFKTIDNAAITASLKELTDGSGNQSGLYVNNAGDFKVSNILEWGSLKDTGTGVTITRYVTSTDGIENFDNNTSLPTSAAVKLYVDSKFATSDTLQEVLSFGNTTGGNDIVVSASDDITFTDTSKILMGASSDLQIYHDGSNSYIDETGSGDLYIKSSQLFLQSTTGENLMFAQENSGVFIYFNNSKKLETTTTGVDVTGNLVVSGTITGSGGSFLPLAGGTMTGNTLQGDNVKSIYGTGNDLEIFHDGNDSYIKDTGTGELRLSGSATRIYDANLSHLQAEFKDGGSVDLYYSGNKKLETTSTGVSVTGALSTTTDVTVGANATFVDNGKAIFGAGSDLIIEHTGTFSRIQENGTGDLIIQGENLTFTDSSGTDTYANFTHNAGVSFRYDNAIKLETVTAGAKVTGNLEVTGTITGSGGSFLPLAGGTMTGTILCADNKGINIGASNDLQITHNGSTAGTIKNTSGNFNIQQSAGGNIFIEKDDGENMAAFRPDAAVELYYNGSQKLATTNTGVSVTGDLFADGLIVGSNELIKLGDGNQFTLVYDNTDAKLQTTSGDLRIDQAAVTKSIFFRVSDANALDTTALTISRNADASFGRDVTIAGDLTVNGTTTTINTEHFNVEDPLISMAKDNAANSVDIGFYGKYNDGTARYLGLFSDASDSNKFKLFKELTTEPTTTVDIGGTGYEAADLVVAGLEAGQVTSSGDVIADTHFNSSDTTVTLSTTGAGVVVLRPNGKFNATGQMLVEASGNITTAGDISLADNKKLKFGAGNDLEIYSDGTDAYVESKVDDLVLRSADDIFIEVNSGANSIIGRGSASVELYYNNILKFETTSTGFNATGSGRFRGEASPRVKAIGNTATGYPGFMLSNTGQEYEIIVGGNDSDKFKIRSVSPSAADLLTIESGGNSTFAGDVSLLDSKQLKLGNGEDLLIFHDGANSYVKDNGTGNLLITSNGASVQINKGTTENMAEFITDGAVKLYYDSVKKFETTSTGVSVTGNIGTSGSVLFDDNQGINFGNSNAKINGSSSDGIKFFGTGSEKMRLNQAGNLGIGTDNPGTLHGAAYGTTKLQIDGGTDRGQMIIEGDTDASIVLSDNGATANKRVFATNVGGGKYTIKPLNDNGTSTAGGEAVTILHDGKVGIGEGSPDFLVDAKKGYSSGGW